MTSCSCAGWFWLAYMALWLGIAGYALWSSL